MGIDGLPWWLSSKESACNAAEDTGWIPGWERSPGGGRHGKPTTVFLPGKSHRLMSLVGYHPWGHKESDMTEVTEHTPPELSEYSKI